MVAKRLIVVTFLIIFGLVLQSCLPAPSRTLNNEEKIADLYWLFSQFGENYAPLEYKQAKFGFNYEDLKKKYLDEAVKTKTNDEFYALMYEFISTFNDAHTSGQLINSDLPSRTRVGYLGFSGKRVGSSLVVKELLPTVNPKSDYPIKVGDKITKLDGVPLTDVVTSTLVKYRNLGNPESNLTYHMNRIFNRISSLNGLPDKQIAVLTINRAKKDIEIELPWVVKDLYDFTHEQAAAVAASKKTETDSDDEATPIEDHGAFEFGSLMSEGKISFIPQVYRNTIRQTPGYNFLNSFVFIDTLPTWDSQVVLDAVKEAEKIMHMPGTPEAATPADPLAELKKTRVVPDGAIFVSLKTYPTYIHAEALLDQNGKPTGQTKLVANMRIDTFSPAVVAADALKEVATTLDTLKKNGVNDIIIDLIDNGGGSLELGMRLAQLFSNTKVAMPGIQFKISESWLEDFERSGLSGPSDPSREGKRRVFVALKQDQTQGKRLSRSLSAEALLPHRIEPNRLLQSKFNIVLMTNEMCASMCDIFTAILKDNGMAKSVGAKTMGAGGNVVNHDGAPNSHLMVNQTESLIVRTDGSYIENNGLVPDVAMDVSATTAELYEPVRKKAVEMLTK